MPVPDRRERLLRDRLNSRRAQGKKTKVATAYRKAADKEIDLHVGEEVEVYEKKGDYWRGQSRGKIGWFPGSRFLIKAECMYWYFQPMTFIKWS